MATRSLPELDRRLLAQRGAFVRTAEDLKDKLREDVSAMTPRNLLRRHPGAALAGAAALGLIAGRIAGGVLSAVLR